MKKIFEKPALCRCEIRLNENIALSWEYYLNGNLQRVFHFTHQLEGWTSWKPDSGCYELYTNNPAWTTSESGAYGDWFRSQTHYTNINSMNAMVHWMNEMDDLDQKWGCETDAT